MNSNKHPYRFAMIHDHITNVLMDDLESLIYDVGSCPMNEEIQIAFENQFDNRVNRDNWKDFQDLTANELIDIQNRVFDYLEGIDELQLIMEYQPGGMLNFYLDIYAMSLMPKYQNDIHFRTRIMKLHCCARIIKFQANVRRRQATIRTIRTLHLTGTLH